MQTNVTIGPDETPRITPYRHRWTDKHGTEHDVVSVHVGGFGLTLSPELAEQVRDALTEALADSGGEL